MGECRWLPQLSQQAPAPHLPYVFLQDSYSLAWAHCYSPGRLCCKKIFLLVASCTAVKGLLGQELSAPVVCGTLAQTTSEM